MSFTPTLHAIVQTLPQSNTDTRQQVIDNIATHPDITALTPDDLIAFCNALPSDTADTILFQILQAMPTGFPSTCSRWLE